MCVCLFILVYRHVSVLNLHLCFALGLSEQAHFKACYRHAAYEPGGWVNAYSQRVLID